MWLLTWLLNLFRLRAPEDARRARATEREDDEDDDEDDEDDDTAPEGF